MTSDFRVDRGVQKSLIWDIIGFKLSDLVGQKQPKNVRHHIWIFPSVFQIEKF